ncbi:MAG: DUF1801 domain-containing protein [Candidatus Dormibacteraeota bacterium]|uniref:DUF1801 domain-containing protein n=1 Tax=Candidatus Amunia macphersoniae TaxID=3127014 RepID=A0A934KK12_9BACT|nr:DUF1801 domain-containing protein [Candidatus Dormibacteraeota bacterium]
MSTAQIDAFVAALPDWQSKNLTRFRKAVHKAAPAVEEGWKWDVPVFLVNGRLVCAMSAFANHTKYNFFDGAALTDPEHLFNSGLDSKKSRSINLARGESLDAGQLDGLIVEAFAAAQAGRPAKSSH